MGFSISKEYPGRFLRGSDVAGHTMNLKIKNVKREKVYKQKERKDVPMLVVYFDDKDKGVLLGKERAMDLKGLFGDDTDTWLEKEVTMYTENKDIFGKNVDVIRFKECGSSKKELSEELDTLALQE